MEHYFQQKDGIGICTANDTTTIYEIINDAAQAYKGIIPADRFHEPYMPMDELETQIKEGVEFWGYREGGLLIGVMGIQDRGEVSLIRHAYVRTTERNKGIGKKLLKHLVSSANKPILIGTWTDALWAIGFYEKNGFKKVTHAEKEVLLRKYWSIPERQVETSVVLADENYFKSYK
jgi:N-acetylglutamate synthase-like GNAT family acetyltransferase